MFGFENHLTLTVETLWNNEREVENFIETIRFYLLSKKKKQNDNQVIIFEILFKVLHFFISDGYTPMDRELMRTFIEYFKPIISEFIFDFKDIAMGFYLSTFE